MTRAPWEEELWPVEPLWQGKTGFILGSGPSLTQEVVNRLRGHPVMVINSTYKMAPWADIWFFTDNNVFDDNREAVESWPGHVITLSRRAKREMPKKVKRVKVAPWDDRFIDGHDGIVRQGRSSGHSGISVGIALKASQLVLLGYDMRLVDGREHNHDDYAGRMRDLEIYEREFLPAFKGWDTAAKAFGVTVLNATPGSALKEFQTVELDEVLSCAAL